MRLADVMDDIAARLKSIPGFRTVWEYPAGSVSPPAAVVSYPESYNPHSTYSRGLEEFTALPVVVVVGKADERSSRDALSEFVTGPGANDVVTALERSGYTAFDVLAVSSVDFDVVRIGDTDYIAALFNCDIVGSGA